MVDRATIEKFSPPLKVLHKFVDEPVNLEIVFKWSPWSSCSACSPHRGTRTREGHCYLVRKDDTKRNMIAKGTNIDKEDLFTCEAAIVNRVLEVIDATNPYSKEKVFPSGLRITSGMFYWLVGAISMLSHRRLASGNRRRQVQRRQRQE